MIFSVESLKMESIANLSTENVIDVNSTSEQTQNLEKKTSCLSTIAVEYQDCDSDIQDIQETILNVEKLESTIEIVDKQIDSKVDAQKDIQIETQEDTQIDVQNLHQYRSEVDKISSDSNDSESDSSSNSSTSSSDSSDSNSSSDSDNDSDENDDNKKKGKQKTIVFKQIPIQNELDGLPPVEDLNISVPEVKCHLFGEVTGMVEELVVIKPRPDRPTLQEETVLFIHRGQSVLGKIFDVFGPVKEPYYTVRFNSVQHLQEKGITLNMLVYYCPNSDFTFPIFLSEIMKMKPCDPNCDGSDAEHPDFSDDEEEKRYYDKLYKQRKYGTKNMVQNWHKNLGSGARQSSKRICTLNTTHTTNTTSSTSNSTNYRPRNSRNRNCQFQRRNLPADNNQFNYTGQFNTYQSFHNDPRDMYYMYNMPPPYQREHITPSFNVSPAPPPSSYQGGYAPPHFNVPPPPPPPQQQHVNYNLDNMNYSNQYYSDASTSTQYSYDPQHPDLSYGGYPTHNSTFYDSNYSTEFSYSNPQYTPSSWSQLMSVPPPPPWPPGSLPSSNNSTNNQ